ncbi:MAG: hypothetical protein ACM3JJ_11475, partial [Hyphomicrobiales bacterium]
MIPLFAWGPLLAGAAFTALSTGRWVLQPAAWLAPIFFLCFLHGAPDAMSWVWIWLAIYIAAVISYRGIIPIPGGGYYAV